MKVLRRGSKGDEVEKLQRWLNIAAGENLAIDGDFGPITTAAVHTFQRRHGLKQDGVVGKHTWGALHEAVGRETEALADLLSDEYAFVVPDLSGMNPAEAMAAVALSQLGARETPGQQNRGPQVDEYVRLATGAWALGHAWCGAFVTWCVLQCRLQGVEVSYVRSGRAIHQFQHGRRDCLLMPWDRIWELPDEQIVGSTFVRLRSSASLELVERVQGRSRRRAPGHTGIIVGLDREKLHLDCVAGNSSGAGHSRVEGTGSVARERYRPGSKHWARGVGFRTAAPHDLVAVAA